MCLEVCSARFKGSHLEKQTFSSLCQQKHNIVLFTLLIQNGGLLCLCAYLSVQVFSIHRSEQNLMRWSRD